MGKTKRQVPLRDGEYIIIYTGDEDKIRVVKKPSIYKRKKLAKKELEDSYEYIYPDTMAD